MRGSAVVRGGAEFGNVFEVKESCFGDVCYVTEDEEEGYE